MSGALSRAAPFVAATILLPLCVLWPWWLGVWLLGTAILLRPRLTLVGKFEKSLGLSRREARIYAYHASLVVLPQFCGMLRFYLGRAASRPLTNARILPRGGSEAAV